MKLPLLLSLLLIAVSQAALPAAKVGDPYEAVIAEKGAPKSKVGSGGDQILNYPDVTIQFRNNRVLTLKPVVTPIASPASATAPAAPPSAKSQADTVKADREKAVARVKAIINQPVAGVPRTSKLRVGHFPYWFHEGAEIPDFNNDDVRATQKTSDYEKFPYVFSDLDPSTAYPGNQIEFNARTKYFYVDRNVPKKRLSQAEMLEISRLYRIIGRCDLQLRTLTGK